MKKILIVSIALFLVGGTTFAATHNPEEVFRSYKDIDVIDIVVPTVVSVPIEKGLYENNQFLVYEEYTDTFIRSYFKKSYQKEPQVLTAKTIPNQVRSSYLVDDKYKTKVDFDVPEEGKGIAQVELSSVLPVTSSQIRINLDRYVSLPLTVSVKAVTADGVKTIVATRKMQSTVISFPKTTAKQWEITFTYAQPLRIAEMLLIQEDIESDVEQTLRFLAQPDATYRVFFDTDRFVATKVTEGGNLRLDDGVLFLDAYTTHSNFDFIPADFDEDGIRDILDNCVMTFNSDQEDIDNNGRGDACDDFDRDGKINSEDNCQNIPNRNQADEDGDGIGDICDEEESRITERYIWIPWVGMGIAGLVLAALFTLVALNTRKKEEEDDVVTEEVNDVEIQE